MELEHRENMILYNVLNQEVVFEEYFCNLLRIDDFRKMFINFISKRNSVFDNLNITYQDFDTEVILKKNEKSYGRADLYLKTMNKEFIFEIKNKEWTDLTKNQPNGYLIYLNNENKQLFFLIPRYYKHEDEIFKRWSFFDEIKNQIFYWEDLIEEIQSTNLQEKNIEIKMFYEFCEYWFNLKTVKFKEEEMKLLENKNLPSLMENLEDVTRNISTRVGLNDKFETIGFMHTIVIGDYRIYFGIDYDIWKAKNLPLSILIQNEKKDYQEFELIMRGVKLEPIEYIETSINYKQFGYVVMLDEKIGSPNYEKTVEKTLNEIIKCLRKFQ